MYRDVVPISVDEGTRFFKVPRNSAKSFSLVVSSSSTRQKLDFPSHQSTLILKDLPPEESVKVKVVKSQLKFFRNYSFTVPPRLTGLRVLISGSGRCGTTTMARYLDGLQFEDGEMVTAEHETLAEYLVPHIVDGNFPEIEKIVSGYVHNVESSPMFFAFPDLADAQKIVHLIRDGRRVVQSGLNRGWYQKDTLWNAIKPDFGGSVFENCCHYWRHSCEQIEGISDIRVRLEDFVQSKEVRKNLLEDLNISYSDPAVLHLNTGSQSSEFSGWTSGMKKTFSRICGGLMDRFYPGWDHEWNKARKGSLVLGFFNFILGLEESGAEILIGAVI